MFMHRDILPKVIFSPAQLALDLAHGLHTRGADVTLFSPGPVDTHVRNITADLSLFEHELALRGDSYLDLLKKHPATFAALARQVQSEIIARSFVMANADELDIVHIYTNEEDIALPFAELCTKPVVFTHHDPFNFLVKYKNTFPKFAHLNWISMSLAQRADMPADTNWVANIYHGIDPTRFAPITHPANDYIAYLGRIVEPKGVHLAIAAVKRHNATHTEKLSLKIAGKHYTGHGKESYWTDHIEPFIDGHEIQYIGFIDNDHDKNTFLGNARALMVPSTFAEPFGMVLIESLACGTPVIGLRSGAISEIVTPDVGHLVHHTPEDMQKTISELSAAVTSIHTIDRTHCRATFEAHFTLNRMCQEHIDTYRRITK